MKHLRPGTFLAAAAIFLVTPGAALAQRQPPPSPEQRIDRLERQVEEVQRRVFPKGRPADTAAFPEDPAATQSSVLTLDQRLGALERQMSDLVRQSEENGNRLRTLEQGLTQLRGDEEQRMQALEQRVSAAQVAPAESEPTTAAPSSGSKPTPASTAKPAPTTSKPKPTTTSPKTADAVPSGAAMTDASAPAGDPIEDAYSEGFHQWEAGNYDDAIKSLRAFVAANPKHRRTSYANNLIGRALLDKGQARQAAEVLLSNYRSNPGGERAPDSLFYLGQALMQLNQPVQACKAYGELDAVYGAKIRPDLRNLETEAKAKANCS